MSPLYRVWLTLRSLVFWIWMIFATLTLGGPVMLGALISYDIGYRLVNVWLYATVYGLKYICGISWKVEGAEHLPDRPCIVLAKHQSTWETLFLPMVMHHAVYVAKKALARIPIFGWTLYLMRFILIDRKSGRSAIAQMVEQSRSAIARGRSIIVFPEGTRRPVGAEPAYRIGGAVVASKTNTPVLPVALNSGQFWPRMGFIKYPGEITVRFGPLIEPAGRKADEILAETQDWIEATMQTITLAPTDGIAPREHGLDRA